MFLSSAYCMHSSIIHRQNLQKCVTSWAAMLYPECWIYLCSSHGIDGGSIKDVFHLVWVLLNQFIVARKMQQEGRKKRDNTLLPKITDLSTIQLSTDLSLIKNTATLKVEAAK